MERERERERERQRARERARERERGKERDKFFFVDFLLAHSIASSSRPFRQNGLFPRETVASQ